jgi:cytoskeletal protein CcmA (bactofilin family)
MFGRKPSTAVGASTTLRGTLDCGGDDFIVAGMFEGTVTSGAAITLLEGGVIIGDVTADVVVVAGRIEGTVVARERLVMRPTGHIQGDARYGSLEVERGGIIDGRTASLCGTPSAERQPALLEGAAPSPVEETMRFQTPFASAIEISDAELSEVIEGSEAASEASKSSAITAPPRRPSPSAPRSTDPWGALEVPGESDSDPAPAAEG